ncbi:MAG: nucleotidyltransferase family protein [Eubacteriales bacterium]|nr:nucleotidyltransferase family protein [Eubacteriales bacterium]
MNPFTILKQNLPELCSNYNIKKIGVFGSYARSEAKEGSDIDMLVEFSEPVSLFTFVELKEHLEEILGCKVDLVTEKALKPRIRERILNELVDI